MATATRPIVRFAPSPTGMLHIGGARTALFNWLYAKHHDGQFLLRIEDTDRERSTEAARDAILNGLLWLGLKWDGDVVYQSARQARHRDIAETLLETGAAYRCYCTAEELAAMRAEAKAAGRPMRYDGRWRDRDPADAPAGVEPVIRIKAPTGGATVIEDAIQGTVEVAHEQLDDFIIMRSDGTPTYMLSVVVDDHDMAISHIIRGDDHLTNAFRQRVIYDALGWPVPQFAHMSLIHGADGAKLSKRHGALAVEAYRDMGYLPEAMRNYLLRLGWSHGDDEIISTEQAIAWFDLDAVGRAPARFDIDKLNHLNGHYIRQCGDDRLAAEVIERLERRGKAPLTQAERGRIAAAMTSFKERAKTLVELAENCEFLVAQRPLALSDPARKQITGETRPLLKALGARLAETGDWSSESIDACVHGFVEAEGLKFGKVAQPLRAALTGGAPSPGLVDLMVVLGRDETLGRIADVCGPAENE